MELHAICATVDVNVSVGWGDNRSHITTVDVNVSVGCGDNRPHITTADINVSVDWGDTRSHITTVDCPLLFCPLNSYSSYRHSVYYKKGKHFQRGIWVQYLTFLQYICLPSTSWVCMTTFSLPLNHANMFTWHLRPWHTSNPFIHCKDAWHHIWPLSISHCPHMDLTQKNKDSTNCWVAPTDKRGKEGKVRKWKGDRKGKVWDR